MFEIVPFRHCLETKLLPSVIRIIIVTSSYMSSCKAHLWLTFFISSFSVIVIGVFARMQNRFWWPDIQVTEASSASRLIALCPVLF